MMKKSVKDFRCGETYLCALFNDDIRMYPTWLEPPNGDYDFIRCFVTILSIDNIVSHYDQEYTYVKTVEHGRLYITNDCELYLICKNKC